MSKRTDININTAIKPLAVEVKETKEAATVVLAATKEKIAARSGEFVSRRIDPRTIVMARPARIKEIIKHINAN